MDRQMTSDVYAGIKIKSVDLADAHNTKLARKRGLTPKVARKVASNYEPPLPDGKSYFTVLTSPIGSELDDVGLAPRYEDEDDNFVECGE